MTTVGWFAGRRSLRRRRSSGQETLVDDLLDDGGAPKRWSMMRGGTWPFTEAGDVDLSGDPLYAFVHFDLSLKGTNGQGELWWARGFRRCSSRAYARP